MFDRELHEEIIKHVAETGADAKLIPDHSGGVLKVNFTEKLLSPLLSKLSNFIPEAGIWMNTLRPEWNDANNALVGYGVSMVTLYYMRRFVHFLSGLFSSSSDQSYEISAEMAEFLNRIHEAFMQHSESLTTGFTDESRKQLTDQLGMAGNHYRDQIYKGFSGKKAEVQKNDLIDFFTLVLQYIDQSIAVNKRKDKMYNAYNLITLKPDAIAISYLYEMLEGQVAVLSSGRLSAEEAVEILDAMRASGLYRADQESYMLYPAKRLPGFLEKNNIPEEDIKKSRLLSELIRTGDTHVIAQDEKGKFHFNGTFRNAENLKKALLALKEEFRPCRYGRGNQYRSVIVLKNYSIISPLPEDRVPFINTKDWAVYTGIWWPNCWLRSVKILPLPEPVVLHRKSSRKLIRHYDDVKKGMGSHKSPDQYGACPFEPYSHTPSMSGVQQPGMTGQVKEDIISRFFELGLIGGTGTDHPVSGSIKKIGVCKCSRNTSEFPHLTYTFCRVPFVYLLDQKQGIDLEMKDGSILSIEGYTTQQGGYAFYS